MKKYGLAFCCVTMGLVFAVPAVAITEVQQEAIVNRCSKIRELLQDAQRNDVRNRVYLGGYYESILTDYIVPFNVRMVENNLSTPELVENQNKISNTKALFASDFIAYQQNLEDLLLINCKTEPAKFYEKLGIVQQKRKTVEQDTLKMHSLISEHAKIATQLMGKL